MNNDSHKPTGRSRWLVGVILLLLAIGAGGSWLVAGSPSVADIATTARNGSTATKTLAASSGAQLQPRQSGITTLRDANAEARVEAEAANNPQAQLALWTQRLQRTEEVLENYRSNTKYPFESRPAREHVDQMYPNRPVREEGKLSNPGQKPADGIRIRTSQERVYVAGDETVLFTVNAVDIEGNPLPLQITRAIAHDPPLDGKPSQRNAISMPFNDNGNNGDLAAGDAIMSARLSPATQGFAGHAGTIRIELNLKVNEQTGFTFFDIFYTPDPPAIWVGGSSSAREAVVAGSLNFYLQAQVRDPGRYVVTGRIDDAKGQPFALISFNEELNAGPKEIKLNLFGKLLVDEKPSFPLTLRDVDGFLLKENATPDRALMPRLSARVLTSRVYQLTSFSEAEWDSEERARYIAEYGRDVEAARAHLTHVRRTMGRS